MKDTRALGIRNHKKRANHREWIGKAHIIGANSLCIIYMHADCMLIVAIARAFCLEEDGRSTVPDTRPLPKETNCVLKGLAQRLCTLPHLELTKEPEIPYQQLACIMGLWLLHPNGFMVELHVGGKADVWKFD